MTGSYTPRGLTTVAVVGAGFSGLLTALHLLRQPRPLQVRLIERGETFGRGAAYGTADLKHLLNVRASNMSAFPEQPDHFTNWLAQQDGQDVSGFVTRARYGDYLQALLRAATADAPPGRLLLDADDAVDAVRASAGWTITTRMGRRIEADLLVLATGVLPPTPPPQLAPDLLASARYVANPWKRGALEAAGERVLLLGTGLTMVDVALSLSGQGRRLFALSRRGLLPQAHAPAAPPRPTTRPRGSPAALTRQLRAEIAGADWRSVIDGWRPHLQAIWQAWSLSERQRFLRHVQPWWDIHRHRLAPAVAERLSHALASGELQASAGRLLEARLQGDRVRVLWSPRGCASDQPAEMLVDTMVNCAGFGALSAARDPLLNSLARQGWLRSDPTGLGVEAEAHGRVGERLYAVGPLCRGALWEITAVPDIRVQAAAVAQAAAADLALLDTAGA